MFESELIIKAPKKPLINRIVFALLYTILSAYLIYFIKGIIYSQELNIPVLIAEIIFMSMLLIFPTTLIGGYNIHFNFEYRKIKYEYEIGPFNHSEKWQELDQLEYISIFEGLGCYRINLWHKTNKILNLMTVESYNESVRNGHLIAYKLNIDLLDATKEGRNKMINKTVYKDTGEIRHLD